MKHLFLLLLFSFNFLVSGFEPSTIVWTDIGHVPISSIAKNDQILAYDTKSFCHDCVAIAPIKISVDLHAVITLENDDKPIICSQFQQFLTIDNEWKKATELSAGDCLQAVQPVTISSIELINKPITLYDLCVVPHHTFCVGNKKVVAHNFVPFIGITLSLLFGAGTALEWSIAGGIAAGFGIFGFAMNKNHKKPKVTVKPIISPNQSGSGGGPDKDDNDDNERKYNIISKTAFIKTVKDKYRYDKQIGLYKKIKGKKGLRCSRTNKEIEYLKWDGTHLDVEAYDKGKNHLGSICPNDYVMYRDPDPGREL
jgi:hypothetical protein